jgi:hypothetical protein
MRSILAFVSAMMVFHVASSIFMALLFFLTDPRGGADASTLPFGNLT